MSRRMVCGVTLKCWASASIDMKPRCHFLDSSQLDLTLQDGIHPNGAGYDLIGKTVWELMQAQGIRR